ncbi:helix-turn-helix transcriptional regulator [Tetragenococcus halophilus]|uniref:helix-turn-helix transcriptional regulator n=1 Tax=Tetragenococcus halophilus TaxID=51669 RepID=UPI001F15F5FF|nr:helix-turn-helix transcriptional regulator [Tetragenococcus halophilus]MCF1684066.1 helix-turn-helix transcriptional regulator [Tetragenococcus halophilus]
MLSEQNANFLKQIAKAIAIQFGEDCEVVVHKIDENKTDHSIIAIENGHITNRHIGDGPSQVVLETLQKDPEEIEDHYNYLTRTRDGRVLKSSTMFYKGEDGKLEAILAINFDTSSLFAAENTLHKLTVTDEPEDEVEPSFIPQNVNDLLDELIKESVKLVGKPVALMTKEDKVKSIQFLSNKGAFLITKSGDKVAKYFNISKYTLYNYIG